MKVRWTMKRKWKTKQLTMKARLKTKACRRKRLERTRTHPSRMRKIVTMNLSKTQATRVSQSKLKN